MPAYAGRDIAIQANITGSSYTNLAGLKTKSLKLNGTQVDVTNSDSTGGWRELLAGAGISSLSVSGNGVFLDDAGFTFCLQACITKAVKLFNVIVPGLGTFNGLFQVSQVETSGEYSAEVKYDVSLESAGVVTFTAS